MSNNDFEKFRELVLADEQLQNQLRSITDKEAFVERVIELGSRHGLTISEETVEDAMRRGRRLWIEQRI